MTRSFVVAAVIGVLASPLAATAQTAPFCGPGQRPEFVLGFAALKGQVGPVMGDAIECEHPDPLGTGDTEQHTTTGLAFFRKSTNTPTFTDGYSHWALTPQGLVTWTGSSVDPPGLAAAPSPAPSTPSPSEAQGPEAYWRDKLRGLPVHDASAGERPATTFQGPFRLPRPDAAFIAGLAPSSAWVSTNSYIAAGAPTYSVVLGPSPAEGNITFWGTSGRTRWGEDQKPPEGCERFTGSYCPYTFYVQGAPLVERFTDLQMGGQPAIAVHGTCCNGETWSVEWYEPEAEVTYGMSLYLEPANALGANGLSPSHVEQARRLAEMASQLVSVRLN